MRRLVVLLAVVAALVLSAGAALADTRAAGTGERGSQVEAESLEMKSAAVPTEGLLAPVPAKNGKIEVKASSVKRNSGGSEVGVEATQATWLNGTSSNTHYWNPIHSQVQLLTTEFISYWGTEDGSYPKVGELYWGKVTIGNINPTMSTPVMAEIELPRNTKFSLQANDPNMKIRCVLENFSTGGSQELTGDLCPQAPKQPGTFEPYQLAPKAGFWTIRPGEAISVIFPIYSTSELKGWAATPADCVSSSIWAAASIELWDAPEFADNCPVSHAQADGVDQGVWVAPNPPTIQYPSPSATNITATGATTTGHLFYHFQPGTAYLDLGTSTQYGRTESLTLRDTNDALAIHNDWTGLKPDTTYHWRLRFKDAQGRTFTGADQTFITKNTPPTISAMRPTNGSTTTNRKPPISATVRDATTDLAKSHIQLVLDGRSVTTFSYDQGRDKLSYTPSRDLSFGKHTVKIVATDARGLSATKSWSFSVVK
jgi:archaellin